MRVFVDVILPQLLQMFNIFSESRNSSFIHVKVGFLIL